jgi:hypothetical protein
MPVSAARSRSKTVRTGAESWSTIIGRVSAIARSNAGSSFSVDRISLALHEHLPGDLTRLADMGIKRWDGLLSMRAAPTLGARRDRALFVRAILAFLSYLFMHMLLALVEAKTPLVPCQASGGWIVAR